MKSKRASSLLWSFPERFLRVSHQLGRVVRRDVVGMTPEQIRLSLDGLARLYPGHFNVVFERTNLNGIPCAKLYPRHGHQYPSEQNAPIFVLVHGGGFAFGSAWTHRAFASALVVEMECEIWIPEYRLAPEHPFPASLEDVMKILDELSVSHNQIWLLGDSAGGNLALSGALEWMHRTGNRIEGLGLFSPWLDLRSNSKSNRFSQTDVSPFERLDMIEYASHYLQGKTTENPLVSPLDRNLETLSRVYIEASRAEYLYPDFELACEVFKSEGLDFTAREELGALHGWQLFPDVLAEAKRSVEAFTAFVKSA
ncbi:MAG TPA: hypothetical protein DD635_07705 [Flavobacteriales bacterium]|nr:hypothetical protein [Flavobacteriales bacterium]|tara:strand:+ start:600 stop:1532 length:933 start_codon:yes stop_codon:yes gene_type:complete